MFAWLRRARPRRAARPGVPAVVAVLLIVLVPLVTVGVASAHGVVEGGIVRVEQTLGGRDLTLTLAPPPGAGTMPVLIGAAGDVPTTLLRVAVVPRGAAMPSTAGTVTVDGGLPASRTDLVLARAGNWEVVVGDGRDTARVPVRAEPAPTPAAGWAMLIGFLTAALLLITAVSLRHRPRWALAVGAVALVGLTVAVTTRLVAAPSPDIGATVGGATTAELAGVGAQGMAGHDMSSMSPGSQMSGMTIGTGSGGTPVEMHARPLGPEDPTAAALEFTDGTSGAPVDDLIVHDEALVHMVAVGPGGAFAHAHPIRVGPGQYVLRGALPGSGRYALFAEIERENGGAQLVRSAIDTGPAVPTPAPTVPGPGPREVAGMRADVAVAAVPPAVSHLSMQDTRTPGTSPAVAKASAATVAGQSVRLTMMLSAGGVPVTDLQPWLGMGGHLLVLGPSADGRGPSDTGADPTDVARPFSHVHDMRTPALNGLYGPEVAFTYTFPREGRYTLWMQVRRDKRIVTVPTTVDVAPR